MSVWIQMRTMKNLKMSLKPLQTLRLPYQYYLFNKDQQPARKDQRSIREDLQVLILVMKTVSTAISPVHSALSRSLRSNQR